ncbi:TlpA family protein disulfide reductase [Tenacibaculum holothuriorum]|uniref:TlpA family protein disulfide reductase n=1 Tax=Tenacibaculum holothuriorum TaxID=1635173 RepID=UPI000A328DBB|nr:TlpA disulfide reductase family protein [Tenacibaculum holothuriorum]
MKKLILLALIGVVAISCKKEAPVKDYLVLTGNVENFKKRDVTLQGFRFKKKIKFDRKTKSFRDTVKIPYSGYYTLVLDKNKRRVLNLFLNKTDDTGLILDFKKPELINYEGKTAAINSYFIKKTKKFGEIIGNANNLFSKEEGDFLDTMDEYKDALSDLSVESNLPADFMKREVKNIDYEYLRNLNNYQNYHRILTGNDEFVVSENFPNVVEQIDFNSAQDYVDSYSYRTLLGEIIDQKARKENDEGDNFYLTVLETIHKEVNDTLVKNDMLYLNPYKNGITYVDNLKEYYKKFMAYSTNESHKKEITKTYNSMKLTAKGQPSPKFKNYENYNGGTTSLDDLLGKGKYLYVDVWATWCAFCKKEIPLLKRLEDQYHGKNIEFVSISVDKKNVYDKWKETIVEREMSGIQLLADKDFKSDFVSAYNISGLPRFILIDPDGNIVSPNAPSPSQGERLVKMFDDLGIQ